MRQKFRQRCSPILLSAIFLAGALAEGVRLNELHTRVAHALQDDAPLEAIHFISASPSDSAKPARLLTRIKCVHQGET